jgi:hypothetical protein
LSNALCGCGGRKPDFSAQLGEWKPAIGGEFLQDLLVNQIDFALKGHVLLAFVRQST